MNDSTEHWQPIPGLRGEYEASTLARIRSIKRGRVRILTQRTVGRYAVVMITLDGKYAPRNVHRLVALAFHGTPPTPRHQVCHADGDGLNNTPGNLRWGTALDNADDMRRHGRHRNGRKARCDAGHEFTAANTYTRPNGQRTCRTCKREYERLRRRRT
ncbi:HNH endonuclease [Gordonia phage Lennon]|nr:HNH endonuclease [Gordonia phage Lennon]ATN90230.1 HNH endonuclease [Gordonia phage Lennon]AYR02417.1 HNH endonuclease [Gordonia phage Affeca]